MVKGKVKDKFVFETPGEWGTLLRRIVDGSKVTAASYMMGAIEGFVKLTYEQTKGYLDAINAGDLSSDDEAALKTLKADLQGQLDLYQPFYSAFCQDEQAEPSPDDAKPKKKGR